MVYTDIETIKDRVEYEGEDFYDLNPESNFDELLTQLEKESRSIIENHMGDVSFSEETDKEEEFVNPSGTRIQLDYPINNVSKIEVLRHIGDNYETLDSDLYEVSKHGVNLEKYPNDEKFLTARYHQNPLGHNVNKVRWENIAEKVRITYDRGFTDVPQNIKSIQITIVNRLLRQLKNEENIQALSPDEAANLPERQVILTDELKNRLDNVTNFRYSVTAI